MTDVAKEFSQIAEIEKLSKGYSSGYHFHLISSLALIGDIAKEVEAARNGKDPTDSRERVMKLGVSLALESLAICQGCRMKPGDFSKELSDQIEGWYKTVLSQLPKTPS